MTETADEYTPVGTASMHQATILERSVCLVLRCRQFGNTKAARGGVSFDEI